MLLHFPSLLRPKKAAKSISQSLSIKLAAAQQGVARACGYRNWHEFEKRVAEGTPFVLDQHLSVPEYVARQKHLALSFALELGIHDGDVQYSLARTRLTGDRTPSLDEQIAIRLSCWRATTLPQGGRHDAGAVGIIRAHGWPREAGILRRYDSLTEVITNRNVTILAKSEFHSQKAHSPLFLPTRLYLPYGYWTERDGARVIFSRDYAPMWRVRTTKEIERLEPWIKIQFIEQTFLWPDSQEPFNSPALDSTLRLFMSNLGINSLPVLADALPLLVHHQALQNLAIKHAPSLLRDIRMTEPAVA